MFGDPIVERFGPDIGLDLLLCPQADLKFLPWFPVRGNGRTSILFGEESCQQRILIVRIERGCEGVCELNTAWQLNSGVRRLGPEIASTQMETSMKPKASPIEAAASAALVASPRTRHTAN